MSNKNKKRSASPSFEAPKAKSPRVAEVETTINIQMKPAAATATAASAPTAKAAAQLKVELLKKIEIVFSAGVDAEYERTAKEIKSYVTASIGEERQVCGGVIDNYYLDVPQILSNNLLLTYKKGPRRSGMRMTKNIELLSFAVCRIEAMDGNFDKSLPYESVAPNVNEYTLYIDVICSKSRDGSTWLWGRINEIAKELGISVKLSSLSYVAAYYKQKKNFNFYKRGDGGGLVPDDTLNSMLENPAWPFFSENAKHEAPIQKYTKVNWLHYLNAKLDPESEGFRVLKNAKKLSELRTALGELINLGPRRDTLPARLDKVNQIMSILKTEDPGAGFQMVSEFFQAAIASGVAVGANIRVLTRATGVQTGQQRAQKMLAAHDIGDNGFTMFSIPSIQSEHGKGVRLQFPYTKIEGGRRKKRTRKRALRKKRRRTKHKKKRRKTHKRKRKRRRRTRKRRR